ncbi:MAG: chemotaxis protein CheX [Synergistales bacterium]|nr:chemotaxis protein CheX [Synergistales bacterium]
MQLGEALATAATEMFPMFGLQPDLSGEMQQQSLNSANPVNILVGLTDGVRGNVVLGLNRKVACAVVSGMMGGAEVNELDAMGKSALAELTNMYVGSAIQKVEAELPIQLSPPTVVTGNRLFLMISRVPATVLMVKFGSAGMLSIRFAVE